MRILSAFIVLGVCVNLALTGCVRPPKLITGDALAPAESESLCRRFSGTLSKPLSRFMGGSLASISGQTTSFRTLLEATVNSSRGEQLSFRYAIVGKDPEMLRIDVLPGEGAYTLALITVRGGDAVFIDPQAKRVTYGCSVKQVLEKLLGLRGMTPAAIKAIVVGSAPPMECSRVVANRLAQQRFLFVDSNDQVAWELDAETGELYRIHFLSSSGESVTAVAARQTRGSDSFVVVSVYDPIEATAEMRIARFTKNPEVADATFSVVAPSGYEREEC